MLRKSSETRARLEESTGFVGGRGNAPRNIPYREPVKWPGHPSGKRRPTPGPLNNPFRNTPTPPAKPSMDGELFTAR